LIKLSSDLVYEEEPHLELVRRTRPRLMESMWWFFEGSADLLQTSNRRSHSFSMSYGTYM